MNQESSTSSFTYRLPHLTWVTLGRVLSKKPTTQNGESLWNNPNQSNTHLWLPAWQRSTQSQQSWWQISNTGRRHPWWRRGFPGSGIPACQSWGYDPRPLGAAHFWTSRDEAEGTLWAAVTDTESKIHWQHWFGSISKLPDPLLFNQLGMLKNALNSIYLPKFFSVSSVSGPTHIVLVAEKSTPGSDLKGSQGEMLKPNAFTLFLQTATGENRKISSSPFQSQHLRNVFTVFML